MISFLLLAAMVSTPVDAQEGGDPPSRVRSVILFGDQQCPKAESPEEIVVCANGGESPFRIPKELRERVPGPEGTSWVRRAETVDEVNRALLPGSCSPIGSYGQSGCTAQMLRQWAAEKREREAREAKIP